MRGKGPSVSYYMKLVREQTKPKPLTFEEAVNQLKLETSTSSFSETSKFAGTKYIRRIKCPACSRGVGDLRIISTIYRTKDGTEVEIQFLSCYHHITVNKHTKPIHHCGLGNYYIEKHLPDGTVITEYLELKYL